MNNPKPFLYTLLLVCPIFSGETLQLQDAVHPFIYEKASEATAITTKLDELSRFIVITGNNMV